ncbi:hypothetical protein LK994_07760 [Ferruginibacter lapsinanis]|uniref:beta strand repeat-containing protein n=1 Tax=Ferruginibacter lapsinanis TaxID=563172 RepID=UPI001E54274D|nr:hypothetical protein [Ferruginibacter lapsinanis]UEG48530.1 hypothetical protein LK994_07760 [Ferruginibacter lapsinanis]
MLKILFAFIHWIKVVSRITYMPLLQPIKLCLLVIVFLCFINQAKSQVIVETFENAAWTSLTSVGAASSGTIGTTFAVTTTAFNITSNASSTAANSVATTLTGNLITGNYTWAYSKASVLTIQTVANSTSLSLVHSYKTVLAMTSSGGYLICPVLPTGIASVSFWSSKTGGGFGGTLALNTNTTTASTYVTGDFSLSSSVFTSGGAGRTSTILSPNFTGPCGLAFRSNGMWIDDIIITPSLSGVKTGTAGSITTNSALISTNVLENGSASAVTVSGICWSDIQGAESISGSKTTDGATTNGNFNGSMTGLASGTTYYVKAYATNGNGTYYGPEISFTTVAVIDPEPTNQPTSFATGTITTTNIPLTWTSAVTGTQAPSGYLIKASNTSTPAEPVDATDPGVQVSLSGGTANAKATPQSATSYSSFTNFTAGTMYYFSINSYTNSGANINFLNAASSPSTPGPTLYAATLPNAVTSPGITFSAGTGTISWTAASGYSSANHTTMVFVKPTSSITVGTPTNNPSTYTANTALNAGTAYQGDASAHCVYKGDGTSATVTGLSTGTAYYVMIVVVVDAANSNANHSYSAAATTSGTTQGEYTWDGSTSTDWTVASNWTPDRTSPVSDDILNFNTGGTVSVTNFTASTYGSISKLKISNNTNVTLNAGSSQTLTITSANGSAADLEINSGSSLTTQASRVNITLAANTTADISGTLTMNSSTTYNTDASGAVTTISGTLDNSGTVTCTSSSNMIVTSTGTYRHNVDGGTIPTGTWNTGSTCLISGIASAGSISGHKQTFSKFVWDCPGQSATHFVLGANSSSTAPNCVITDSFIVKRTGGKILQITSTGGQRDFVVGNFFQYGGNVAVTYNTDDGGTQRSLTVTNTFYVTDSIVSGADFQIINQPSSQNITGRLFVNGIVDMHSNISSASLSRIGTSSKAEIIFGGTSNQPARFNNIVGDIDFIINNPVSVTLGSDVKTYRCKLSQGNFYIGANTLTINGPVSYPSPASGLFAGSSTSNLSIGSQGHSKNDTTNVLNFLSGYQLLKNFSLYDTCKATLGTTLALTAGSGFGTLKIDTSAILTTNDQLTLKSDANGTARIDSIPVDGSGVALGTITGKITVERYLPMNVNWDSRRWRLIGVPVSVTGTPTLKEAWQEGATPTPTTTSATSGTSIYNPNPGYGTHITNGTGSSNNGNGFDAGSTNNPSIYKMEPGVGQWTVPGTTTSAITNYNAYMIFVRGDRSIVVSSPYINTTGGANLRIKGNMNVGDVTKTISAGKQVLCNPYASSISLNKVLYNGVAIGSNNTKKYYLWDPKLWGSKNVGSWVSFTSNANNTYLYVPNPIDSGYMSSYGTTGLIESGGAFLINAPSSGSFVFHESDKIASSTTIGLASRPGIQNRPDQNNFSVLYTNLAYRNSSDQPILADGVATVYAEEYNNEVDEQDVEKMLTFSSKEKISLLRNANDLAIEKRRTITIDDTIFLQMNKLDYNYHYQLQFKGENFTPNLAAYLIDEYLGTKTVISTTGITRHNFETDATATSLDINRFKVVFRLPNPSTLPVVISSIKINQQVQGNEVEWNVENQLGVKEYEIERSSDGITFKRITSVAVATVNQYSWLDETLVNGITYYRIKIINQTGEVHYSAIAKINRGNNVPSISVYPAVVTNGAITLQLNNAAKGDYHLQLINGLGQLLFNKHIGHNGGNAVMTIPTGKLATGIYQFKVIAPDKQEKAFKVLY